MRYGTPQPAPDAPTYEVDAGFTGLFMKPERSMLQPGQYSDSNNKRVADGVARKRPGSILPFFANFVAYGAIVGSFVYSDPRGDAQMLIATPGQVWRMISGAAPVSIALPAGVVLTAPVRFVQVFDKVLLLRGENDNTPALQWDGTPNGDFQVITKSNPLDTSTVLIPNVARGVAFNDRFVFPFNRTELGVSDVGDYSSYDHILADFLINLGTSDVITCLFPYAHSYLIVGKTNRIEIFSGFTDKDHPENATADVLSSTVGVCAWDSVAMTGGDALFLSEPGGVYRFGEVIENRIEANPVPVSDPIEPLIRRINWPAAGGAVAKSFGQRYYLAVPIDGSLVNNCLAIYNTATKAWEGYDTWDPAAGMQIDNLLIFGYAGEQRLYAINHAAVSIHLLEEGKFDETKAGTFQIADRFVTRGYATAGAAGATERDDKRLEITLGTWWPSITVTALTERANDERPLTSQPITRDPRKFQVWGRPDTDTSNVNSDHGAPGRADYAVIPTSEDAPIYFDPNGIEPEKQQQEVLRFSPRIRTRALALRIESTQGDCDIYSVLVDSVGVQRSNRRAA